MLFGPSDNHPNPAQIDLRCATRLMLEVSVRAKTRDVLHRARLHERVDQFSVRSERAAVGLERAPNQSTVTSKARAALRRSAVVTIHGSRGWDSYRLRQYFYGQEQFDRI